MKSAKKASQPAASAAPVRPEGKERQSFVDLRRSLLIVSSVPRHVDWLVSVRYRAVGEKAVVGMPAVCANATVARQKFEELCVEAEKAGWIRKQLGVSIPLSGFDTMPKAGDQSMRPQHV